MKIIPEILKGSKTIAVVGFSSKPERASHALARYMQEHGYRIVPVNPAYAASRSSASRSMPACRRRPPRSRHAASASTSSTASASPRPSPRWRREPSRLAPRACWMQLGIENRAAADLAEAAGLDVVMDRCIKIEHEAMSH